MALPGVRKAAITHRKMVHCLLDSELCCFATPRQHYSSSQPTLVSSEKRSGPQYGSTSLWQHRHCFLGPAPCHENCLVGLMHRMKRTEDVQVQGKCQICRISKITTGASRHLLVFYAGIRNRGRDSPASCA